MKSKKLALIVPVALALGTTLAVVSCSNEDTKANDNAENFKQKYASLFSKKTIEKTDFTLANQAQADLNTFSQATKNALKNEISKINNILLVEKEFVTFTKTYGKITSKKIVDLLDYNQINDALLAYSKLNFDTQKLLKTESQSLETNKTRAIELQKTSYLIKTPSKETMDKINEIIAYRNTILTKPRDELITLISEKFINTPYVANKMYGNTTTQEALVMDVNELDCFTYLDYVVAFSMSSTFEEFKTNLIKVRYIDSRVSYLTRKHFYTDWSDKSTIIAKNVVTKDLVGEDAYATGKKKINAWKVDDKGNITKQFIPGLESTDREISYIKWDKVNDQLMSKFKSGDMIMLYTNISGLDVTHTGFLILKNGVAYYRNASSLKVNMKVVDTKLVDYLKYRNTDSKTNQIKKNLSVPGILVYRVLNNIG